MIAPCVRTSSASDRFAVVQPGRGLQPDVASAREPLVEHSPALTERRFRDPLLYFPTEARPHYRRGSSSLGGVGNMQ